LRKKIIKPKTHSTSQGASLVDPENAPGKRSELDPLPSSEIGNLPPEGSSSLGPQTGSEEDGDDKDGEGQRDVDVSMADCGDDDGDSGDDSEDEVPAQLEATRQRS